MAADDLNKPLGMDKRPKRRWPDPSRILAFVVAAILAVGALWAILIDDPLGGEPVAVVAIERTKPQPAKHHDQPKPNEVASAPAASEIKAAPGPAPAGPLIIKVPRAGASPDADPAGDTASLSENSKHGAIPRIASDGRRPADIYASTSVAEAEDKRPKIAILIGGLGISRDATSQVLERLPRAISLGFTPYGDDLEAWATKARENGHEIMLQVPMEPFDYPNNDPGPQTLLTTLPPAANLDRLNWVMSRMNGYFGLTSYMGAKFTASEDALTPVLTEAGRRGLVFLDNGSSPRSLVASLGPDAGASVARAELVIDATPSAEAIDAALARLEDQARRDGAVIGVASALPVTIGRLEAWAAQLTSKGLALVPVSAVVKRFNPS